MPVFHSIVRAIHISAGSLGLIFGFIALFVAKGARLHKRSGMFFVYAMFTMGVVGAIASAIWGKQRISNIPVGLFVAYLVVTGLITVRPPASRRRAIDVGLVLVALGVTATFVTFGSLILANPSQYPNSVPPAVLFVFGAFALMASLGDLRLIEAGGTDTICGPKRIARHLWRLTTALLIAAFSFPQVLPKALKITPITLGPPLIVLAALLYWMWKIRLRRNLKGITQAIQPKL